MTSPPPPTPAESKSIGQYVTPLRDLAAYVLAGASAAFVLAAVIRLFDDVTASRHPFIGLATVVMPLAAVLLAHGLKPVHPKARLITLVALGVYAVMGFFGVIFDLLVAVIKLASHSPGRAFETLLVRIGWLAVFALAAYALVQIWRGLYLVPKPKPQPGVYGQPQTPFGQQPYGQAYGQPPFPGQPQPGMYGQPVPAPVPSYAPGTYGQPPAAAHPAAPVQPPAQPSWNQPLIPTPPLTTPPPASAPPASAPPAPAAPAAFPVQPAPFAEPTQVVPRDEPAPIDRTSKLPDERPGFGPADSDPPRH
ncbi:hypothetical protein [Actinoplanes sp. NPDC020271]|uniref:hypothetical protein n=1 Tax=Actinoplanes sp. NPDC020271 TaxID=3363896 RepID=UPI003794DFD0